MVKAGWLKKQSLSKKLMAGMLLVGLLPLLFSSLVMNWQAGDTVREMSLSHVDSLVEAKTHELEEYFRQLKGQLLFLSEEREVVEAMSALQQSFSQLPQESSSSSDHAESLSNYYRSQFLPKLKQESGSAIETNSLVPQSQSGLIAQSLYILRNNNPVGQKQALDYAKDGSAYSGHHKHYHQIFRSFAEKFGYYDIFLIEPKQGTVVYSVFKELDYGTSLASGPFRNSGLAEVYNKAKSLRAGQSVLVDFAPYVPSYNAPASFIGAPIYSADGLSGVLVFQLPSDKLNGITHQKEGLGESGEIYLVGKDGAMRSQSRLSSESTMLKQVASEGLAALGNQRHVSGFYQGYQGEPIVGAYTHLEIPGVDWQIAAEIRQEEVFAPVQSMQLSNALMIIMTALIVSFGAWIFSKSIVCRVKAAGRFADSIAHGRFDNKIDVVKGDELDDLQASLNQMQTELFGKMRESEVVMNRLKVALDVAGVNVMVADHNNNIIYLNRALQQTLSKIENQLRTDLPNFRVEALVGQSIDIFHKNPQHQRGMLASLQTTHTAEISVGGRLLQLTLNPIVSEDNERLGTVTEWVDLTEQRATEKDIEQMVANASAGVLDKRLNTSSYQGFYKSLAEGLNQTLDAVAGPLQETRRVMQGLAEGDLNVRVQGNYEGEFRVLGEAVNTSAIRLSESMVGLNRSVKTLTKVAQELARDNTDLHNRTTEQSNSLQQTASAMEQITGTVEQNTENSRLADGLSAEAVKHAKEGNEVVDSAIDSIRQISDSSAEIASIIEIINEIAFQTNLLALNAAVEAARAGDQGRGFAVVASEVRGLAGRSAEAAKQIEDLIKDSISKVERGTSQVHKTGESLKNIVESITRVSSIVREISLASEEQTLGITDVNGALTRLESVTQNNLALVGEISGVSEHLNQQAEEISSAISVFSFSDNSADWRERKQEDYGLADA